jgi:lipid-binding SYLF domain-containing protein
MLMENRVEDDMTKIARYEMVRLLALVGGLASFTSLGCATTPDTAAKRQALESEARATLATMMARDSTLAPVVARSHGYAVFPRIGKGGVVAGGAYGRGVLFERGRLVGYAELTQASLGLQLGGQTYAELIVFPDSYSLLRMKHDDFDIGGNVSAVVISAGAGASATVQRGNERHHRRRDGGDDDQ